MSVLATTARLEQVVRESLPALNEACQRGDLSFSDLVGALKPVVDELVVAVADGSPAELACHERERVMVALGFITGSVERHAQTAGRPIGSGIAAFSGYAGLLAAMAANDLPARDTARTFWLANRRIHGDALLTYTLDRGERFFNQQVCELDAALSEANAILRVSTRADTLTATDAEALGTLPALVRRYKAAYTDFRRKDAAGPPITPFYFMTTFRTYLPTVQICGDLWHGPNAAWLASVFSFDALLGTAMPWYRRYSLDKAKYLTATELDGVKQDFGELSVMDVLAARLGLPAGLGSVPTADLAARLASAPRHVLAAARSVRDSWLELVKGTKSHETLVRDFLDRPSAALADADVARMAVKPSEGTGGGTRDLLADIGQMRKTCIAAQALVGALRVADSSDEHSVAA